MIIEKIPPLTCKKCGSSHIVITNDGPECDSCDIKPLSRAELTQEVEYLIYQRTHKENKE